jgi:dolichyl-phosphate-mannose-protein mannosyltransferase
MRVAAVRDRLAGVTDRSLDWQDPSGTLRAMRAIRTSGAVPDGLRRRLEDPGTLLPAILIGALVLRVAWLALPPGTLIFDEAYYVNAARVILGWTVDPGAPYAGSIAGLDPNVEHPPLGKLLIAGSMAVFGDNGLGWRLPSVVAGMISLGAMYRLVRAAGETAHLAILVVFLLALDNLMLVHSRLGTLDMLMLAPMLVAAWLALEGRWLPAGVLLGLGFLVKITAILGLLAVLLFLAAALVRGGRPQADAIRGALREGLMLLVAFATIAIVGLWLLDARFTAFTNPVDHLHHMIQYGTSLTASANPGGFCAGITSAPWQWPFNTCQINYLRVDTPVLDSAGTIVGTAPSIDFRGALNPLLASAIPLASLAVAWQAWTRRDRLSVWAVTWIVATFLPFVLLVLVNGRVTYFYYVLPVVPAAAVTVVLLLFRSGLPRFVAWGYLVAYVVGFAAYFPFRQLP